MDHHLLSFRMIPTSPIIRRHVHTSTAAATTTTTTETEFLLPSTPQPTFRLRILFRPRPAHCHHRHSVTAAAGGGIGVVAQDAAAAATVLAGAYGLVSIFDIFTQRNLIPQNLSRKLVHILSGLLFALSWPIFSTSTEARYFASLVPTVNCLRLLIQGFSLSTADEGLIKSVSREGNPEELLRGPLYYVVVLILCALIFWRESPCGLISLAMMCGGDGVADIIGRRFGSMKIPYNPQKSWAGSISMFTCGFLLSIGMLYYYSVLGYFQLDWPSTIQRVALVALVATAVESLPITSVIDDNISVPLASMITAYLNFGH